MHVIPAHQARPSDDPIFALNREATERRARGERVVNATVGALLDDEGRLAILPSAARAIREVKEDDWAAYAPIAGTPAFLEAVRSDLFASHAPLLGTSVAIATPGGTGALRQAIGNYLEPGQSLLTTNFFWGPYETLADESDRRVETFPMFDEAGRFHVEALDHAVGALLARQKRVLLFLNDPCHNPTGYSMDRAEWREVAERLGRRAGQGSVTVLVDMAYGAYGARSPNVLLEELAAVADRVEILVAWSASKSFTHYGLRVGALVACVANADERARTNSALTYSCRGTWSNCNRGGMAAITRLLTDADLARSVSAERDALKRLLSARVAAFNRLAPPRGLRYPRYEGGFFVTVFHDDAQTKADRMKQSGVFVVPQKGALRVALCSVAERDVADLVEALAAP